MPPVYRIAEVCIYSLLNFLPFLALALYPFRHCLRFSKAVSGLFIGLLSIIQMLLGFWAAFVPDSRAGIISAVSTALYFLFYLAAVKKHFGKTLFTLLMLSNLANLAVRNGYTRICADINHIWQCSLRWKNIQEVIS